MKEPLETRISWPAQSKEFKGVRILNNVVWDNLDYVPLGPIGQEILYKFISVPPYFSRGMKKV